MITRCRGWGNARGTAYGGSVLDHHHIAGTGERGFSGDGGPAVEAQLNNPFDVGFDPAGNLYFSDTFNHRIRRVDGRTGVIATVAGNGAAGYAGDGGPATEPSFNEPYGIAVDRDGNIYVADRQNHCVRRIDGGFRHRHDLCRHRRGGICRRWRSGGASGNGRAQRARL